MARGFAEKEKEKNWKDLINEIVIKRCLPILGPGIVEYMVGSRKYIAKHWAEKYKFPMKPHNRENLPQVAQYLSVRENPDKLIDKLAEYLCNYMRQHYSERFSQLKKQELCNEQLLDELICIVGDYEQAKNRYETHRVLAELHLPLYITANVSSLLSNALKAIQKEPKVEVCHWRGTAHKTVFDREPNYNPNPDQPLVYHIFGHLKHRYTMVFTEDDYFDYLIAVFKNKMIIPVNIQESLVNKSLLFIGFGMTDWDFRILFRLIYGQEGREALGFRSHVAVQINPSDSEFANPEEVRNYLERYFEHGSFSRLQIYWGGVNDFFKELQENLKRSNTGDSRQSRAKDKVSSQPLNLFYAYAHEDENFKIELQKHLASLRNKGLITEWHDRNISPGTDWEKALDEYISKAHIILLLISPAFLASDYINNFELIQAMKRHEAGEARVIPVILRSCLWQSSPFGKLQCLPTYSEAIDRGSNIDEAFTDVTKGILKVVEEFKQ